MVHFFFRYIYTGKAENLQDYALDILKAAEQYNLEHLKRLCQEFLVNDLTHDNVVNILKIANTYNANFLRKSCIYYIVKQMVFIAKRKQILDGITLDDLTEDHSNVLFEIFEVLTKHCHIKYL